MDFLALQGELPNLTQDDSTDWAVGGTKNKAALNRAYERLYDILKITSVVKSYVGLKKVAVTVSGKEGSLPADFDSETVVSLYDFADESEIELNDGRYYKYEIQGIEGAKKIVLEDDYTTVYVGYVQTRSDLSANGDIPKLPKSLHKNIADYALVEYFRAQRDNGEAMNALGIAQAYLNEQLATI